MKALPIRLLDFVQKEPAVVVGLVDAGFVLAVTFGVPIRADQKAAIDGVLAALLAIAAGVAIRTQVSPVVRPPAAPTPPTPAA